MKITKRQLQRIIRKAAINEAGEYSIVFPNIADIHSGAATPETFRTANPLPEDDADTDAKVLGEYDNDFMSDSPAAEKDAFLDSMVEMWVDHFGMAGVSRSVVIQALNDVYLDLLNEY